LSDQLREAGAQVIEAPTIEIGPPADWTGVDKALRAAGGYDWIVFTSANGATHTRQRLMELGLDARAFGKARIAAVGDVTAEAVRRELCLKVDLMPARGVADALADDLERQGQIRGKRFLLLRADIARPVLRQRLQQGGAAVVDDVAVYETRPASELPEALLAALDEHRVDWVTFTSSSTASNFASLLGTDYAKRLAGVRIASIGPITTQTLRELGLTPTVEAANAHIDGLVSAMLEAAAA
jgi:uroporphyrinogen III methyltransferase/synthase